ncbi:thioredoxin family protein [Aspergillus melleus]|uniref:thioredoxin family protein n=1 Tax=Aspergillus melleus TaxID=138277 RepID=UPI001E8CC4EB|nr:uncharacterized protein LDX57_008448 [Aspergillus melleus]KAH8430785.1 hypothetical protein LDX57_008448 [Aspergillus melleus]
MPLPQITDQAQLDRAINDHKSSIIIFSAIWSPVSEATKDNFEKAGAKYPAVYQAWISIDENADLAQKYDVTSIPTTIGFKDGAQAAKFIGPQLVEPQVEDFIRKVL